MDATKVKTSRIINWTNLRDIDCVNLIDCGLHAHVIGDMTGMSRSQVYYRAKKIKTKLRDYRDGKGPIGSLVVKKFTISPANAANIKNTFVSRTRK